MANSTKYCSDGLQAPITLNICWTLNSRAKPSNCQTIAAQLHGLFGNGSEKNVKLIFSHDGIWHKVCNNHALNGSTLDLIGTMFVEKSHGNGAAISKSKLNLNTSNDEFQYVWLRVKFDAVKNIDMAIELAPRLAHFNTQLKTNFR